MKTSRKTPRLPERLTPEAVQRYKSRLRSHDRQRLEQGSATPHQIEQENSAVERPISFRVLKFAEQ